MALDSAAALILELHGRLLRQWQLNSIRISKVLLWLHDTCVSRGSEAAERGDDWGD